MLENDTLKCRFPVEVLITTAIFQPSQQQAHWYQHSHLFFIGKEVHLTGNHSTAYCPFNGNSLKVRSKCFLQGKAPVVITFVGMCYKGQV